jgi:hypothetical protein
VGLDAGEVLLAHALHVHQLLRGLEPARLLPVLDDAGGELGAHAGQLSELLHGRGVDVHLARRGRLARGHDDPGRGQERQGQREAQGDDPLRVHLTSFLDVD